MDKYDRQTRLWKGNGQHALRGSSVLVLGYSLALTEAMKNLCLAGVGHITIVDNGIVSKSSISNNFFLAREEDGISRATAMQKAMAELNPDTLVDCIETDPLAYFRSDCLASKLRPFRAVLAGSSISTSEFFSTTKRLLDDEGLLRTVFLQPVCTGLLGTVSSYFLEFITHKTHEPRLPDLRYGPSIWPELARYVESYGELADLADAELEDVPYPIILEKCLRKWAAGHQNQIPSSSAEKLEFKASIKSLARTHLEENINEAFRTCWQVWSAPIPDQIQSIISLSQVETPKDDKWLLIQALKLFIEQKGQLPVSGKMPDMNISSAAYRDFQKLYTDKAKADLAVFHEIYDTICEKRIGIPAKLSERSLRSFCQNTGDLRAVIGNNQSYPQLMQVLTSPETDSAIIHQLMMVATEILSNPELNDWATDCGHLMDTQFPDLKAQASEDIIRNFILSRGLEIHSVATTIGAVASQEVIKHIIEQYTPLAHHFAYDACCSWMKQTITAQVHG